MKLSAIDLISIQECLDGYLKLIKNMDVNDEVDFELKEERLNLLIYLISKCEVAIDE